MRLLNWPSLVLAVGAVLLAGLLESYRWKLLLPANSVSLTRMFFVKNAGKGINSVSPVRMLGDVTQLAMLSGGDGIKVSKALSTIVLCRFFDLLVTMSLVGVGLVMLPQMAGLRPIIVPLWVLTMLALVVFLVAGTRLHRLPVVHQMAPLRDSATSIGLVSRKPLLLLTCLALTGTAWMSIGTAAWLVALAAGIHLPFWLLSIVIVAVTLFSSALPTPPGAVGAYEFVAISALGLFSVDPQAAMTFALVTHVVLFLPPIIVSLPIVLLDRHASRHLVGKLSQFTTALGHRRPAPQDAGRGTA